MIIKDYILEPVPATVGGSEREDVTIEDKKDQPLSETVIIKVNKL